MAKGYKTGRAEEENPVVLRRPPGPDVEEHPWGPLLYPKGRTIVSPSARRLPRSNPPTQHPPLGNAKLWEGTRSVPCLEDQSTRKESGYGHATTVDAEKKLPSRSTPMLGDVVLEYAPRFFKVDPELLDTFVQRIVITMYTGSGEIRQQLTCNSVT